MEIKFKTNKQLHRLPALKFKLDQIYFYPKAFKNRKDLDFFFFCT